MTIHCACWRCTGKAWNDGTMHGTTHPTDVLNPDPLRAPGTDAYPDDDEDSGLWAGVALMLTIAVVALVVGFVVGRLS